MFVIEQKEGLNAFWVTAPGVEVQTNSSVFLKIILKEQLIDNTNEQLK